MCEKDRNFGGIMLKAVVALAMVVMAIAILTQAFAGGIFGAREQARRTSCLNNLKQLGLALKQYSQDFRDRYPWQVGLTSPKDAWMDIGMLYVEYNSAWECFICPSSRDRKFEPKAPGGEKLQDYPLTSLASADNKEVISYAYGVDFSNDKEPTGWTEDARSMVRLLADKKAGAAIKKEDLKRANHKGKGRNVLYNDGHAKWAEGADALDPDPDDDVVGKPNAKDYAGWWSDPPYYREGMKEEVSKKNEE